MKTWFAMRKDNVGFVGSDRHGVEDNAENVAVPIDESTRKRIRDFEKFFKGMVDLDVPSIDSKNRCKHGFEDWSECPDCGH